MYQKLQIALLPLGLLLLASCVSYQEWPLDPAKDLAKWDERSQSIVSQEPVKEGVPLTKEAELGFDFRDGMNFFESQALVTWFNPELVRQRAEAGVMKASADNADLWADPTLDLSGSRLLESADNPWGYGIGLSLTIPLTGRLTLRKDLADRKYTAAKFAVLRAEWRLAVEHWRAWNKRESILKEIAIYEAFQHQIDAIVMRAGVLKEAGQIGNADERHLRIQAEITETKVDSLASQLAASERAIRAMTGLSPKVEIKLSGGIPKPTIQAKAEWRETVIKDNVDLMLERWVYEVREVALELEVRRQYPEVTLGPYFENDKGETSIGLARSLQIPLWNRNKKGIAEALAARQEQRLKYVSVLKQSIWALERASNTRDALLAAMERKRLAILPLIEEQLSEQEQLAEAGVLDVMLIAETLEQLLETRLELNKDMYEANSEALNMTELLGLRTDTFKEVNDE